MKKIAIIAAVAATVAAPAFAQSASTLFAIQHFNQSFDSAGDIRVAPSGNTSTASVSGALGQAFAIQNGSADSAGDLRGTNGVVTIASGTPAYAADIFLRLQAESAEDE